MQHVYWDVGKDNPTAKNTRKPFGGRGSAPDPVGGAYSAPANPLAGGEGLAAPPQETHPPLPALRDSLPTPCTPKLVPTPLPERQTSPRWVCVQCMGISTGKAYQPVSHFIWHVKPDHIDNLWLSLFTIFRTYGSSSEINSEE